MNPAEMLEGMKLEGGWEVVEKVTRSPNATGGYFSTGYRVRRDDGREGFLKAMDYSEAFDHPNPAFTSILLQDATARYNFEKSICERCSDSSLKRVVHAIGNGTVRANPADKHSHVNYLIFEMADGDVRAHLDTKAEFDVAFAVRALHHVAGALNELHRNDIAHQDLKPSNVLVFSETNQSKVGDLGRAWSRDLKSPHDDYKIAGDKTYAPLEFLYRHVPRDVGERRFRCDIYHLGSLAVFLFTRTHMNALIIKHLSPEYRHNRWGGTDTEVLPYVLAAFSKAISEFEAAVPEYLKPKLIETVKQLCEPDPRRRGHPLNTQAGGFQHSLERYLSTFDYLAYLSETKLLSRG